MGLALRLADSVGMGIGGASSSLGGGVLPFRPNESALLAREVKDGGCGRLCGAGEAVEDENMGAVARFVGNKSSSSGSRSGSTEEGSVEVELYRAEAPEES
jgi:hypothetical protein